MIANEPKTILDSLKYSVEQNPDKIVYTILDKNCQEEDSVSFAQLYNEAKAVAQNLRHMGLKENKPAALASASSKDFIITFIGCLLGGIIPVPLPAPRGTRQVDRIKNIMMSQGFNAIITDQNNTELFTQDNNLTLIEIGSLMAEADTCELPTISGDDVAFLQYTSGSTSRPKGVTVTHRNIIENEKHIYKGFGHNSDTVILGWLPFHHDMGLIGNMLQPLFAGLHSIVMSPLDFLRQPANWLRMISKYQATTSGGPNFSYDLCIAAIKPEELEGVDLSSWNVAFNGSEMIKEGTINKFTKRFKQYGFTKESFQTCYGLAEATLFVTSRRYHDNALNSETHKSNIGCGFTEGDTIVDIVDPVTNTIVADSAEGEVWIKGSTVTRGYWNDKKNTQEIYEAFTDDGKGPYLRTGDLAYKKSGDLFITGRLKNLIIIRGQNIHPIDVETAVHEEIPVLSNFRAAIFSVREDDFDQLVIIHEVANTKGIDENVFKSILSRISAEFQVDIHTIAFVKINHLPRTTSGKIQIGLARQMFLANEFGYLAKSNYKAALPGLTALPDMEAEQVIERLLGIEKVAEDIPLIEYGLDSLKAIRLIHGIEEKHGVVIDLPTLLSGLCLREIRKIIDEQTAKGSGKITADTPENITAATELNEAPLSLEQENIWLAQKMNPGDCSYNIPILLKVKGQYRSEALQAALTDVVKNYHSLSIVFEEHQGSPRQVIKKSDTVNIKYESLQNLEHSQQNEFIQEMVKMEACTPFDLATEYAYRISIYACADDVAFILLNFHHIVCDGWSFNIFKHDFITAYSARCSGNTAVLTQATKQAAFEYALQQRKGLGKSSEQYWQQQLTGTTPSFPLSPLWDTNSTNVSDNNASNAETGDELRFALDSGQSSLINQFCRENGVTPAAVFLGLYHCLLHNYTKESTLINYASANRQKSRYSQIFGCFVNTLVSREEFNATSTIRTVCKSVHGNLGNNYYHEDYPFVQIIRDAGNINAETGSALSRFFFVMQNAPMSIEEIDGLTISVEPLKTLFSMYDLVLEVQPHNEEYVIKMEYKKAVIPQFLIEHYKESFLALINQLIQADHPLCEVSLGTLELSAESDMPSPRDSFDVLALIRQQADKMPDKIALMSDAGNLSYVQLVERVDKLAGYLSATYTKPKSRVVLPCTRSAHYIVNLLAVLASGGCYIPLDFSQPKSSLNRVLDDVQPDFILGLTEELANVEQYSDIYIDCENFDTTAGQAVTAEIIDANLPAYIIYTSGSTGKPKGIEVSRKSLNGFVQEAVHLFQIVQNDKVLQFAALNWDTSSEEIFPSLVQGATLVLRSNEPVEHYDELIKRTVDNHISVWNLPSSYWKELSQYLENKKINLPASLRLIIIGGESVSRNTVKRWYQIHGGNVKILNTYGATELTSISMACDLKNHLSDISDRPHLPIGKPLNNTEAFILDKYGCSVPVGSVGKLHFSGESLAIGYFNNEALTKQNFYTHQGLKRKLYNTGDYAYYDNHGVTYLVGRNESFVKRRGVRIDLSTIENVAEKMDGVSVAVADMNQNGSHKGDITLYLAIPEQEKHESVKNSIKKVLDAELARQYQPDIIRYTALLPKLSNGKNDIRKLKELSLPLFKESANIIPENLKQGKLIKIWQDVLGHSEFNSTSLFNEVGGNSLLILKLKSLIEEEFKIDIPVAELFSKATIIDQANFIDSLLSSVQSESHGDIYRILKDLEDDKIDLNTAKETLDL